jgi:CRISPR-associated protein Cmr3
LSIKLFSFQAVDTLFFREGIPFNAGEGGLSDIVSSFPPSILTLQGAIRTALALGCGWLPGDDSNWPQELGTSDSLGCLKLEGPYLKEKKKGVLFPAPLFLVAEKDNLPILRLFPGHKFNSDLGEKRFPSLSPTHAQKYSGVKTLKDAWLTLSGMEKVISGGVPEKEDVLYSPQLWASESRIGIERDRQKRAAIDRKLYSLVQIRPFAELELMVRVRGLSEKLYENLPKAIPLGGESRLAYLEILSDEEKLLPDLPEFELTKDKLRFTVSLLAPWIADTKKDAESIVYAGPPGIPGECISACVGRVSQLGGWDLKKNAPRALKPAIPAGSTWFYEAPIKNLERIVSFHGKCQNYWGFGQIIIGRWEE